MSRLLWFVLGGIAAAVGAGVAATMLGSESESDFSEDAEEGQDISESQDDSGASEQSGL